MYVPRNIRSDLDKRSDIYKIIAVVGPRQSGKTTFLRNAMDPEARFVLFNDPEAREIFDTDIKAFRDHYMRKDRVTILDEVQYCTGAGDKLKFLADTGYKIWLTSSSETILSKEVLSYLVGRVTILRLFPFDIKEFLKYTGDSGQTPTRLRRDILEHIRYGGYPKVVTTEDTDMKRVILTDLIETILLKDVAYHFSISDLDKLYKLVRYIAARPGMMVNMTQVGSDLGISFKTLKAYLEALQRSYILWASEPFSTNKAKEIVKQPRLYFIDTGVLNNINGRYDVEPDGFVFENHVISELLKQGFYPKHWRTTSGAEIDIILDLPGGPIPIEVKLNKTDTGISRSMRSFVQRHKTRKALVVSLQRKPGIVNVGNCNIAFLGIDGMEAWLKD